MEHNCCFSSLCVSFVEIEREKKKAERQIKQHAKEGNISSAKVGFSCWRA